jgi:hypothetical protein
MLAFDVYEERLEPKHVTENQYTDGVIRGEAVFSRLSSWLSSDE